MAKRENRKSNPNEIKDLSELANIRIEEPVSPDQEEIAIEQAIKTGEAQVKEIVSEIEEDKEKGLDKAEVLGGEEGRESLSEALKPIEEEEQSILNKTKKEINEPVNTEEILNSINELKAGIDELKEEGKKDALELKKLQEEEANNSIKTETRANPTKAEHLKELKELESKQDNLKAELEAKKEENKKLEAKQNKEDLETTGTGSNEIKNPKYKIGQKIKVRRSSGKVEEEWYVIATILRKEGRTIVAQKGVNPIEIPNAPEGTTKRECLETEIDELNKENEEEFLKPISLEEEAEKTEEKTPEEIQTIENKNEEVLNQIEQNQNNKKEKPKIDIAKVRKIAEQKIELMAITEGRDLTDEEKIKITQEVFLQEKEIFDKNQSEKAGRFTKALNATENWWLGIDNKGNKLEQKVLSRSAKVALATAITSVGAIMTNDVSRLVTRVSFATGVSTIINTALASNKVKEILSGFSTNKNAEEDKKLAQKIFNAKNAIGALSVGTVFVLSGPIMALVAGGGVVCRELVNYYFDKNIPKLQEEIKELEKGITKSENDDDFDINKLLEKLNDIEKQKKELANTVRWDHRYKSILNTTLTAGIGFASYQVATAESGLENTPKSTQEEIQNKELNQKEDLDKKDDTELFKDAYKEAKEKSSNVWERVKSLNPFKGKEASVIKNPEVIDNKNETNTQENTIVKTPTPEPTKTEIPKEAIIDGKERVGITYALRDQLKANKELADYFKIDQAKLDDAKYVAKVTKELAIKFGYMDNEGHEIRISEDGKNNIAYVFKLNADGKPEINEMNVKTGAIIETHNEGYSFEKENFEKEHEYFEDKKYSYQKTDNEVAPGEAGGENYPKPEKIITTNTDTTTPDSLKAEEIVPPEKIVKIDTYTYANIDKSPIWEKIKGEGLKDFFAIGKSNMNEEQIKVAEYLRDQYKVAVAREPELEQYIQQNPNMTLKQANELYNNVIKGNYKPIDLGIEEEKTINSDALIEKIKGDQELQEINKVADKFDYEITKEDLEEIKKVNNENINKIFENNKDEWNKLKDFSARKYMKITNEGKLSNYLDQLQKETGLKPKNGFIGLGKKEQIDEYITRCLLEAQKNGKLYLIKPIIEEEFDIEKMKPAGQ